MDLRYVGFDQQGNTRSYRFDRIAKGQPPVHLVVTADLALFLARRVNIQEGPSLCARKLSGDPDEFEQRDRELTNEDLLAYATARADAEASKAKSRRTGLRRRTPPRPPSWEKPPA